MQTVSAFKKSQEAVFCIALNWDHIDNGEIQDDGTSILFMSEQAYQCSIHTSCDTIHGALGSAHGAENTTLNNCLEAFSTPEILDGINQYYCAHCKEHRDVIKSIQLYKLPDILVLHFKRFR